MNDYSFTSILIYPFCQEINLKTFYFSTIVSSIFIPKCLPTLSTVAKTSTFGFNSTTEIGFPFGVVKRMVSAFWRIVLNLFPSHSASTRRRGLFSIFTLPTIEFSVFL